MSPHRLTRLRVVAAVAAEQVPVQAGPRSLAAVEAVEAAGAGAAVAVAGAAEVAVAAG